jgi:hypothetical protein
MNKLSLGLSLLLSTVAFTAFTACTDPDTGTGSARVIIEQSCAADADCPAGFECELEDEHGVVTSFCQSDDDHSDGTCPAGYELEVEHGQSFCQPHGGDDDGSGGGSGSGSGGDDDDDDDGGTGTGAGQLGEACASAADCSAGLECEVEVEHGTTTATCQPHGGN